MIKKVVNKHSLNDKNLISQDLEYWLSRKPEERIGAVEILRRNHYGHTTRLQRTAIVIQQV